MLRGLIEKTEDESDKRRPRYRATVDALAHLGVTRVGELPRFEEFANTLEEKESVARKEVEV